MSIFRALQECGYDDCGIIGLDDMAAYIKNTQDRIAAVPASEGFYKKAVERTKRLREEVPWAESIVIAYTWLGKYRFPAELRGKYGKGLFVSRSSNRDGEPYRQKQKIGEWFDAQGIRWTGSIKKNGVSIWGLRQAAEAAGIGITRKNNFIYCEKGSWLELNAFLIDRRCRLYQEKDIPPCPQDCSLCRKACPTGALSAPYTLNPNHCVSLITTFGKGVLPEGLRDEQIGQWLVGCDACQDICPFNRRHDWDKGEDYPGLQENADLMQPENILAADDETLSKRICALSCGHLQPDETETLRINAARALRNREKLNLDAD